MTEIILPGEDIDIFNKILNEDNVCIYMHRSPDGDTIATALALKRVLQNRGKRVTLACGDEVSRRLKFITGGITLFEPEFEPDVKISVDVASASQLGTKYEGIADEFDYAIDHHYTNTRYAKNTIVDPNASSAGEVLFMLLRRSGEPLDRLIAKYLYTAISFDTGCFKFSNVRPQTLLAAARLLEYGFDSADINRSLFDLAPMRQLMLEKTVIDNLQVYLGGKVVLCCITQSMLKGLGIEDNETEGMTNVVRRLEGSVVSVTMRQMRDGVIRVSLRSECDFNVANVAAVFGGGGHVRASGCSISEEPPIAIDMIIRAITEEWNKTYK